ncbi:OmpH family outer membrane protein [Sorangium sp. So ce124]|uniref:OmpH family outer membrane protein n=1 Tax=Sorangium sp. So ce124 TaxID=3133280 RepID=UPI003F636155
MTMRTSGRAEHEAAAGHAESAITNSLEQVRDILCGAQFREFARRLAHTDAQVAAQAEELRSEARRRLDALEAHMRSEIDSLSASIEAQRAAADGALGSAARESREALELIAQRVQRLEELVARTQRELRQQLLDQSKSFLDETRRTRSELSAMLERELAAVWADGTDAAGPAREAAAESERYQRTERRSDEAA